MTKLETFFNSFFFSSFFFFFFSPGEHIEVERSSNSTCEEETPEQGKRNIYVSLQESTDRMLDCLSMFVPLLISNFFPFFNYVIDLFLNLGVLLISGEPNFTSIWNKNILVQILFVLICTKFKLFIENLCVETTNKKF